MKMAGFLEKIRKANSTKYGYRLSVSVAFVMGIGFLIYTAFLLYQDFSFYREGQDFAGFLRWLLGIIILLTSILVAGLLNYRLIYRRLIGRRSGRGWYVAWHILITWIIFEMLQKRTDGEPELTDENLAVTLFVSALLFLFAWFADSLEAKRNQTILQKQKAEAELRALQYQVNPHFLFNALNTIYAQALVHNPEGHVPDLVQKLSSLLRFTLEKSIQAVIPIEEELEFLQHFVDLHRARLPPATNDQLHVSIQWDEKNVAVAPLLVLPFIENAFQYGLHPLEPGRVKVDLTVENRELHLKVENGIHPALLQKHKGTGQGIANARQRLLMLYPERHQLTIDSSAKMFRVYLHISLDERI